MRLPRLGRLHWALWLGLLASNLHAALPILIAADLLPAVTLQQGPRLCSAASAAARPIVADNSAPAPQRPTRPHPCGICPLCLALAANAAFTTLSKAMPPFPNGGCLASLRVETRPLVAATPVRAYRSRAPPRT
jgi:hypothetical protein